MEEFADSISAIEEPAQGGVLYRGKAIERVLLKDARTTISELETTRDRLNEKVDHLEKAAVNDKERFEQQLKVSTEKLTAERLEKEQ